MATLAVKETNELLYVRDDELETVRDYKRAHESIHSFCNRIANRPIEECRLMTLKENIFIAKRMLVDNVYKAAKLENIAITYPETIELVELNKNIGSLRPHEVTDVVNLKRAWFWLLDEALFLNRSTGLDLIQEIHTKVAFGMANLELDEIGKFRKVGVQIGGTRWRPERPDGEKLHVALQEIINGFDDVVERAIELYLWSCRNQVFKDGNKRTSNFLANFELIKNGCGILTPPPEGLLQEFRMKLIRFYETNDGMQMKLFLLNYCYCYGFEGLSLIDQRQENTER